MSLASEILAKIEPISSEKIKLSFQERLAELGFDEIMVDDVEVDIDGSINITFVDSDNDELEVLFIYDEEEGPLAIPFDGEDEFSEEEITIIDLDPLSPKVVKTKYGTFLDLVNLDWLNTTTVNAILSVGEIQGDEPVSDIEPAANNETNRVWHYLYGFKEDMEGIDSEDDITIDEARKISVIRGGKRVRLPVVRKIRRKIMTGKQKASIRRAVRKRKVKQARTNRKRKRSLKVRKRMGVKTVKLSKFQKVAGRANRKI
jgi:hypothetical protein